MSEQRLTSRLTAYWHTLRKEAPLPNFAQFNQSAIGDIWQNCLVFTAQPSTAGNYAFRVQALGENLIQFFGHDLVGREASRPSLRAFGGGKIAAEIEIATATQTPVEIEGKFVTDQNKVIKYRACLLPFASASQNVTHIVAGLSWREF